MTSASIGSPPEGRESISATTAQPSGPLGILAVVEFADELVDRVEIVLDNGELVLVVGGVRVDRRVAVGADRRREVCIPVLVDRRTAHLKGLQLDFAPTNAAAAPKDKASVATSGSTYTSHAPGWSASTDRRPATRP